MRIIKFENRADAGRQLAHALLALADENPIVLALPRGGVPVAAEVADALDARLDVFIAHKIGAPTHPELAIGAVAEGGVTWIDAATCRALGIPPDEAERLAERTRLAVDGAVARYRGGRGLPDLANRTVILVDDGLATGSTARAAVSALAARRPRRLVLAVPVADADTAEKLRTEVDELVVAREVRDLGAVGYWYRDFSQTSDDEVTALLAAAARPRAKASRLQIPVGDVTLAGDLGQPADARGLVVFVHGSGSGRRSPRNRAVAQALQRAGFATLLFDLLDESEQALDARTSELRFDIALLATRLVAVTDWIATRRELAELSLAYFGASTGAAAALVAAAARPHRVAAVVSRGGRVDLADRALGLVRAPTLLVVGSDDETVLELNEHAVDELECEKALYVVEGAGHLFEEPGALDTVIELTCSWLDTYLKPTLSERIVAR